MIWRTSEGWPEEPQQGWSTGLMRHGGWTRTMSSVCGVSEHGWRRRAQSAGRVRLPGRYKYGSFVRPPLNAIVSRTRNNVAPW